MKTAYQRLRDIDFSKDIEISKYRINIMISTIHVKHSVLFFYKTQKTTIIIDDINQYFQ